MLDSFLGLCVRNSSVNQTRPVVWATVQPLPIAAGKSQLPFRHHWWSWRTQGTKAWLNSTAGPQRWMQVPWWQCETVRLDDKHSLHPWPFQVALLSRAGHSGHMCWHAKLPLEIQPPGGRGLNSPLNRLSNDQATHVGAYHVLHGAAPDALSVRKGSSQKTWCRSDRRAN